MRNILSKYFVVSLTHTLTVLTSCYLPYQLLAINTMYGGVTAGNDLLRKEIQIYITHFFFFLDSQIGFMFISYYSRAVVLLLPHPEPP